MPEFSCTREPENSFGNLEQVIVFILAMAGTLKPDNNSRYLFHWDIETQGDNQEVKMKSDDVVQYSFYQNEATPN